MIKSLQFVFSKAFSTSIIVFTFSSFKASPLIPIISGIEELAPAITGQPAFWASIIGNPKPSYNEGYRRQKALLYNILSFSEDKPDRT